jgi:hypothetical protein
MVILEDADEGAGFWKIKGNFWGLNGFCSGVVGSVCKLFLPT